MERRVVWLWHHKMVIIWTSNCNSMYFFSTRKWFTYTFLSQIQSTHTFLLQKGFEHTCFDAKTIYTHFFVAKTIYTLFFVAKTLYSIFLSQKRFMHFVRKVFARWKLSSGSFRLFGPLLNPVYSIKICYHGGREKDKYNDAKKYKYDNTMYSTT